MKKMLLMLLLAALMLSACGEAEVIINDAPAPSPEAGEAPDESEKPEEAGSPESAGAAEESIEAQQGGDKEEPFLIIDPQDEFMNYGYTHFMSDKDAVMSLKSEKSGEIEWAVYLLDSEFTDAERYIPQVYEPAFTGVGDVETGLEIKAGVWVYIYCGANGWTGLEVPEGASMSVFIK